MVHRRILLVIYTRKISSISYLWDVDKQSYRFLYTGGFLLANFTVFGQKDEILNEMLVLNLLELCDWFGDPGWVPVRSLAPIRGWFSQSENT